MSSRGFEYQTGSGIDVCHRVGLHTRAGLVFDLCHRVGLNTRAGLVLTCVIAFQLGGDIAIRHLCFWLKHFLKWGTLTPLTPIVKNRAAQRRRTSGQVGEKEGSVLVC